jgi:peptidyl-tRNA hydrolase
VRSSASIASWNWRSPVDRHAKQVIVVRKDLGMRKGKMIAQGAHAAIGALQAAWEAMR